jgi:hypothetical protein
MSEHNDHDLLIQVNTKLEMMISTQNNFLAQIVGIVDRVGKLEIKDRGDSERLQTISQSVQQSLQNHSRLNEQALMIENLEKQIEILQKKSTFADNVNMVMTAISATIAGAIGYFFGPK